MATQLAPLSPAFEASKAQKESLAIENDLLEKSEGLSLPPDTLQMKSQLDSLGTWQAIKVYKKAFALAMIAAFTAIMDGYQLTLNGSIVSNKGFIRQMSDPGTTIIYAPYVSAWGGIHSAGQFFGQVVLQFASDRLGRKKALYIVWLVMCISIAVECASRNWQVWLVAKLLAGTGIGMIQATLPLYINEHAPTQLRGFLINAYTFWFVVGQILSPLCLRELSIYRPYDWLVAIYTQWAMVGIMIIIFVFLPESPWWLASRGRTDEAVKILHRFRGHIPGYSAEKEVQIMTATIEEERRIAKERNLGGMFAIFKGTNGWRLLIALWPKMCQQFVGLSVFNNYSTYFFQIAGNNNPFQVTMILACCQLISLIIVSALSDGVGRRPFVIGGYSITVAAVLALGIVGFFDYKKTALGNLLVFFACLATFSTTGASALGYAYLTEIPSQALRARTAGWGLASSNLFAIMFSYVVPIMLKGKPNWGVKTGIFFACTGLPVVVIAYFLLPETARRSPAEIDEMFAKKVAPRKFRTFVTDVELSAENKKDSETQSA